MEIELKDVSHVYQDGLGGQVQPIRGVNLNLKSGDTVSLLGPSGSGKSTLLHILGLLLKPSQGEVIFDGRSICMMDEKEKTYLRSYKIGFVFQRCYLIPTLTVKENILLPLWIKGRKKMNEMQANQRVDTLLKDLDLADRTQFLPHQLSGGQRRRVALARALANEPDLILADEPTAEQDESLRQHLGDWLMGQGRTGKIVVVATHDVVLAKNAEHVYSLKQGCLNRTFFKEVASQFVNLSR
ncbi:MAG: ABC transporter ATP-binding protein [Bacillota bacterium]